jgi:hypothetical protein
VVLQSTREQNELDFVRVPAPFLTVRRTFQQHHHERVTISRGARDFVHIFAGTVRLISGLAEIILCTNRDLIFLSSAVWIVLKIIITLTDTTVEIRLGKLYYCRIGLDDYNIYLYIL